jgi:hypothetical protein
VGNLDRIGGGGAEKRQWHMHEYLKWDTFYSMSTDDMRERLNWPLEFIPGTNYFGRVRREVFPGLHRPHKGTFGRCTTCYETQKLADQANTVEEREAILGLRDHHKEQDRIERDEYTMMVARAKNHPDEACFVAVDQSKSVYVPRFRPPIAVCTRKHRLEIKVGGGINFSFNNIKYIFFNLASWGSNVDLVLTQLFEMIWASVTADHSVARSRTLHIHADNCVRENKNQVTFAFCAWMLHLNWFDEVLLSFLLVGHTGNEIDSVIFSSMHKHASFENMLTFFDVALKASQHLPRPRQMVVIDSIYNFRKFFCDHLPGVQGHSKCRHFKFERNEAGNPVMRAKMGVSPKLGNEWSAPVEVLCNRESLEGSSLERFNNDLKPVFDQVQHGLETCLKNAALNEEEKFFVQHLIRTQSLSAASTHPDHRAPLIFTHGHPASPSRFFFLLSLSLSLSLSLTITNTNTQKKTN